MASSALFEPIEKEVFHHQMVLGRICNAWAMLDRGINSLIGNLLQMNDAQVACLATELDPVVARTRLLRKSVHASEMPDWWRAALTDVLNRIENQYAPLRNRCIHDSWRFRDGKHIRIDRRAFIKKVQAGQPDSLLFDLEHSMSIDEMEALIGDTLISFLCLTGAERDIESLREKRSLSQAKSLLGITVRAWKDMRDERKPGALKD